MKNYINQVYNEGLATTFYLKPIKFLEQRISNKKVCSVLKLFVKVLYTLIIILLLVGVVYFKIKK